MKTLITMAEFQAQGTALYGKKFMDWRFRCPACKIVLHGEMYRNLADSPERAYTECIGRYKKDGGCDWAAYGLFSGPKEVVDDTGKHLAYVFAFADEEKLTGEEPVAGRPEGKRKEVDDATR